MNKQVVTDTLNAAITDAEAIERKLKALIRDQRLDATILAIALTRLENLRDDILNAIDEVQA